MGGAASESGSGKSSVEVAVAGRSFSLEEISTLHKDLRGKNAEISGFIDEPVQITREDIVELSRLLHEVIHPYPIKSHDAKIYIDYCDNRSEKLLGIEPFTQGNGRSSSATYRINVDLSFIIHDPRTNSVHEFKLDIVVRSLSAYYLEKKKYEERDVLPKQHFDPLPIGYVVTYQNLALARGCVSAIDGWVANLPRMPVRSANAWFAKNRRMISSIFNLFISAFLAFIFVILVDKLVGGTVPGLSERSHQYLIFLYVAIALSMHNMVTRITKNFSDYLAGLRPLSWISFSEGDRKIIEKFQSRQKKSLLVSVVSIVVPMILSIVSGVITYLIVG